MVSAPLSCGDGRRSHASGGSSRDIFSGFSGARGHVGGLRLLAVVAKLLKLVTCLFVGGLIREFATAQEAHESTSSESEERTQTGRPGKTSTPERLHLTQVKNERNQR